MGGLRGRTLKTITNMLEILITGQINRTMWNAAMQLNPVEVVQCELEKCIFLIVQHKAS